jgi:hypothetical protein
MSSGFIGIVTCARISFLYKAIYYSIVYTLHSAYPFICCWAFGFFHPLATVNNATTNMDVQVCLQNPTLSFLDIISPEVESLDQLTFPFLIF